MKGKRVASLLMAVLSPLLVIAEEPYLLLQGPFEHEVMVPVEGVKTIEILATITIPGPVEADGVRGWRIAVEATGGTLKAIDLEGLHVSTLFDHDGDDGTPLVPFELDLADAGSATSKLIEGPPRRVVSTVVLHLSRDMVLAEGEHTIARIAVDVPMPAQGACDLLKVDFVRLADSDLLDGSYLITSGGLVYPPSYFYLARVITEGVRFILSMVPAWAEPSPEGDFVLAGTVPPGDFLLEAEVLLTSTHPLPGTDGPQGWSLSIVHDEPCMEIESFTLEGVRVSTVFDHDGKPETPPLDPYLLDLKDAEFKMLEKGDGRDVVLPASARGLVSAVILNFSKKMNLHSNATDLLLRVVYRIPVTKDQTTECRVDFIDGLLGSHTPVHNVITWMGATHCAPLETRGLAVRLTGGELPFRRGDANSDGELDVSDAAFILENLFLGGPRPSCRKSADLDDNGSVEITDPIYLLNFLFLGGPPPRDARVCRVDPTPDALTCLSYLCD